MEGNYVQLVNEAKNGNSQAFEELYKGTYNCAYYLAKQLVESHEDALDVVQTSYVKAFASLDGLRNVERFKSWLFRIVTNTSKDHLRGKRTLTFSELTTEDNRDIQGFKDDRIAGSPEMQLDISETSRLIQGIIEALSDEQRFVIMMYYFNEQSIAEMAQDLDCSENTVKSRLYYARNKIKEAVLKLEAEGTKLYGIAPVPFFVLSLNRDSMVPRLSEEAALTLWQGVKTNIAADGKMTAGKTAASGAKAVGGAVGKGLVAKIVIGAVAAAVVCAVGVSTYIQSQQGESPVASSSNTTSQNVVQQPPSSVSVPASSSSEEEPKEVYRWVIEPSLAYDTMMPVPNENSSDTMTLGFLDVYDGRYWGVNRFDGSVVFEPIYTDEYNNPMGVCGMDGMHDVPLPDALWNGETTNQTLAAVGLPYEVDGGHGGGRHSLLQHPDTGQMISMFHGDGFALQPDGITAEDFWGNPIPALPYYRGLSGLAEDFSNVANENGLLVDYSLLGLARTDGTVLLAPEYTRAYYYNGFYALEKNGYYQENGWVSGQWAYYSTTTEQFITDFVYDLPWVDHWQKPGIGFFNEGLCPVAQNGRYGYIDTKGNTIVPLEFEGATHVHNGRAWVKQGGLWGQIEFVRELVEPDITDESGTTYRTTTELNLRYGPGTEYEPPLQTLPAGSIVYLAGYMNSVSDEWIFVDFDGVSGWVSTQYIEPV